MRVYRVENNHGRGPYRCSTGPAYTAARVDSHSRDYKRYHPSPYDDPMLKHELSVGRIAPRYFFGFISLVSLKRWFPPHKWQIFGTHPHKSVTANREWYINMYDTDDYKIGINQVLFDKSNSILIGTYHTF